MQLTYQAAKVINLNLLCRFNLPAHRYIKAPKDTSGEELQAEQALRKKHKVEEDAFGTYASQGGEKFVYRVKKGGSFGGYKVCLQPDEFIA